MTSTPLLIAVAALGYFVDIFDLTLFSIVRIPSLAALGVPPGEILGTGAGLLFWQQAGLLLGGVGWGVLGDRRGRVGVLFGSIFLYSAATAANAFVSSVTFYAALRFLAGLGLAAELGAAVTLVTESMPRLTRGWGAAIVAGLGLLGASAAALVSAALSWKAAYLAGGALGLALLTARYAVRESPLFTAARRTEARRGDLVLLFSSRERTGRYLACLLAGLPICFGIGVLAYFAPELAASCRVTGPVGAGPAVMAAYLGMALGDIACASLSQALRRRRPAVLAFMALSALLSLATLGTRGLSPSAFYALCAAVGAACGYWIVLITSAAEQFGTNLRATAATSIPNLVRGLNGPLALGFHALAGGMGAGGAAALLCIACALPGLAAVALMQETFGRNLRFTDR